MPKRTAGPGVLIRSAVLGFAQRRSKIPTCRGWGTDGSAKRFRLVNPAPTPDTSGSSTFPTERTGHPGSGPLFGYLRLELTQEGVGPHRCGGGPQQRCGIAIMGHGPTGYGCQRRRRATCIIPTYGLVPFSGVRSGTLVLPLTVGSASSPVKIRSSRRRSTFLLLRLPLLLGHPRDRIEIALFQPRVQVAETFAKD